VTCNVVFDEQAQWDLGTCGDDDESSGRDDAFMVEYTTIGQAAPEIEGVDEEPVEQSPLPTDDDDMEMNDDINGDNLDANHNDDALLLFCSINDILWTAEFVPHALVAEELHVVSSDEPVSLIKAECSLNWRKAMLEEMMSIEKNDTWSLINLPPGRKLIGVKWVFKVTLDEHGAVSKHKAHLVVKCYEHWHVIDYEEVFMLLAQLDLMHLLIALVEHEGWEVHHMDIKSAILNVNIQEEVYVKQSTCFIITGKEHKVLKLRKVLYGLHQAPHARNIKMDDMLFSLGFWNTLSEHATYVRWNGDTLVVGVYVDDLVITGLNRNDIKSFKEEMVAAFKMSNIVMSSILR
jgi:hypothetical protein